MRQVARLGDAGLVNPRGEPGGQGLASRGMAGETIETGGRRWPLAQTGRAPATGDCRKGATGGDDPGRDDNKTGSDQRDRENESRSMLNGEGGSPEADDGESAETDC